jgi:hypothetical protein
VVQQLWRTLGSALPLLAVGASDAAQAAWALATRRARRMPRGRAWVSAVLDAALVLSVLPVLYLVLVPIPGLGGRTMTSLVPGAEIAPLFGEGGATAAESALWQILGNLVLFMPLGALAPLRLRSLRSVPRVLVAARSVR